MNTSLLQQYASRVNEFFIGYGGYVSLILYVLLAYAWFAYNPFGIITKFKAIAIVLTLVIGYFVVMTSDFAWARGQFFGQPSSSPSLGHWFKLSGSAIGILFAVGVVLFGMFWVVSNFGRFIALLVHGTYYLAIIGALGILYRVLAPMFTNVKTPAFIELIKNVVFYLPCLFIDLIDNIAGTKRSIWILMLVEIAVIALYFLLPILMKSKYLKIGTVLVQEPQYLNNPSSFDPDALREISEKSKELLHYAITADVWINPQPTSTSLAYTRDTNILSFGDRLKVEYNGKSPRELIVKAMEGKEMMVVARPQIPLQRWNKIVLNYDHGTLDIFINGELVHSQQNTQLLSLATISAGSQNGINGGIKDVRWFDKPLTKNQIDLIGLL
jgi:hypothetical protein